MDSPLVSGSHGFDRETRFSVFLKIIYQSISILTFLLEIILKTKYFCCTFVPHKTKVIPFRGVA